MAEKEMRICTLPHKVPGDEPGRFKQFELGDFYPADEIEKKYSRPITPEIRKMKLIEVMQRIVCKRRGLGADGKPDVDVVSRQAKMKTDAKERDALLDEINGKKKGGTNK